jgi:hypothetical protein
MMDVSRFFILWLLGITFENFVFLLSVGLVEVFWWLGKNTLVFVGAVEWTNIESVNFCSEVAPSWCLTCVYGP